MIEKLLMAIVLGVLNWLTNRQNAENSAKAEVYHDLYMQAKRAFEFEVAAVEHPRGGADLRVRPGASGISLSGPDAPPPAASP